MANRAKKTVIVQTAQEWNALDSDVSIVFVKSYSCNDASLTVLNVSRLTSLQELSVGDYCFENVEMVVIEGLPSLNKVIIGSSSFREKSGSFTLKSCPSLKEMSLGASSFAAYSSLLIEGVPLLEELVIPSNSFVNANAIQLEGLSGLKKVAIGESVMVNRQGDFVLKSCTSVVEVSVGSGSMRLFKRFEVAVVPSLETIRVGDECFANVNEVDLNGLSGLKRVVVGMNSFTLKKNGYGNDPTRGFSLRNCPALTTLEVGRFSFSDYSTCVIEGVNALEAIGMGDLNEKSYNFYGASLELKSGRGCGG